MMAQCACGSHRYIDLSRDEPPRLSSKVLPALSLALALAVVFSDVVRVHHSARDIDAVFCEDEWVPP